MSRPCVCGGSNENCRYCGGRGEIPDRLASALIAHHQSPPKFRRGRKSKKQQNMELDVEIRKLERRIARTRILSTLVTEPTKTHAQTNSARSDGPLPGALTPPPVQQQTPASGSVAGSKLVYELCPVCKVNVRSDRLNRHLAKVHKSRAAKSGTKHVAKPTLAPSASDALRENTTFTAPRDKNLNATKLYAHSYREGGRFGSHPSHDGFDDESGPE